MKKTILMLLVAITMGVSAVAQKFEVIREYPFVLSCSNARPTTDGFFG